MSGNEVQTRAAICGSGILVALVFLLAHLPPVVLVVPVAILFLGFVADPMEIHAAWYGMLNTIGIFDLAALCESGKANLAENRHYFWFGEVAMAAVLAGIIAFPLGFRFAGQADPAIAFTGAALLFLLLFVFLPKIVRHGMREDTRMPLSKRSGKMSTSGRSSGRRLLWWPGSCLPGCWTRGRHSRWWESLQKGDDPENYPFFGKSQKRRSLRVRSM